ncbi:MAG: ABC transporter substrate-binding protein [Chloroflexota bacterium]
MKFGAIANASQSYVVRVMKDKGLDKKYGLDVTIVNLTSAQQQWTSMRSGDVEIASGSVLDLLRQRQAGLKARAIRGSIAIGNEIVTVPDKPYKKLSDLKGARVGTPSTTLFDWMIVRAAGKKAENFDIGTDTQAANSSPPLLNEQLLKGQLDAALQFAPDNTLAAETQGKLRKIASLAEIMQEAGFDPQSFYLEFTVTEAWTSKNPGGAAKLVAAMDDAINVLETDDSVWPALAKASGVEDPAFVPEYMKAQRLQLKTTFDQSKLQPTQQLLDEVVKIVGQEPVGVTKVDPAGFDFDAAVAAKKLESAGGS